MKIEKARYGPYGMGWWGFKIETRDIDPPWNHPKVLGPKYGKITTFTISLGTQTAWDGYQVRSGINRAFGLVFYYGKPKPGIFEESEEY